MSGDDVTTTILREIRDEIVNTKTELKAELAATRTELKAEIAETRTELKAEIAITNERLATVETTLQDLAAQQLMLTRYVGNVVDRHETAIDDLRERVTRLETKSPQ